VNLFLILGLVLSGLIGLSLGLIGGGGSIITVPVLVYVLGVEAHEAVGMSLAVVGATSLVGSILHYRRGNLQLKTDLTFGAAGIAGALIGSPLTRLLSTSVLMLTFATLMLVIAILMLRRKPPGNLDIESAEQIPSVWKAVSAGFVVGVLTGFLGVGGGFLIVPALVMFGGLSMKDAIGTSLFVIFLNCVAGLIGHASQNNFDWSLTAKVTSLAVVGTIFGTILSHRVAANKLQKGFAAFVLAVAVFLLAKNYTVFFGG
jgi:uncharacterized membrane protein YfcA